MHSDSTSTSPTRSQFQVFNQGTNSIPSTQALGYPAQLNHPGFPGGVEDAEVTQTQAFGADAIEAAERTQSLIPPGKNTMIDDWDSVLQQNVPLMGVWTSDAHKTDTFGPAQYIFASSLDFDPLMRSYYEGREFMAGNSSRDRRSSTSPPAHSSPIRPATRSLSRAGRRPPVSI